MALQKLYITGVPGQTFVEHPSLAYVEVMLVLRSGKMRIESSEVPVGIRFKYFNSIGRIGFAEDQPILTSPPPPSSILSIGEPEIIYVEFKS